MKKALMILLAVSALYVASSCEKKEVRTPREIRFEQVSFETGAPATRLSLNGLKVNWSPSDVISVCTRIPGNTYEHGNQFTNSLSADAASATFRGELPDTITRIYAAYPYSTVDHWNRGSGSPQVYVGLKQAQTAVKNGIDPDAAIMWATARVGDPIEFHVVNSFIKFTIDSSSPAVRLVTVKEATRPWIHLNLTKPGGALGSDVNNNIKDVTLSSSSVLEPGDYYVGVLAENHPDGLTIMFTLDDDTIINKKTPAINLERAKIYPLGAVRQPSVAPDAFKVGDVYTEGSQKAVVFSVDESGLNAIAMSVDRSQLHYAEFLDNIGATSQTNGLQNMTALKNYQDANPTAEMPAYSFCAGKGTGWYLPSLGEFKDFVGAYEGTTWDDAYSHRNASSSLSAEIQAKRAAFDAILTSNGGAAMNAGDPTGNGDHYWTSSEYSATSSYPDCAYQVRTGKLYVLQGADAAKKNKNGWVRCAKKISK